MSSPAENELFPVPSTDDEEDNIARHRARIIARLDALNSDKLCNTCTDDMRKKEAIKREVRNAMSSSREEWSEAVFCAAFDNMVVKGLIDEDPDSTTFYLSEDFNRRRLGVKSKPRLVQLIDEGAWDSVVERSKNFPEEAGIVFERQSIRGRSEYFRALSYAVEWNISRSNKVPLRAIKALAVAFPEALDDITTVRSPLYSAMLNTDLQSGVLPLLVGLRTDLAKEFLALHVITEHEIPMGEVADVLQLIPEAIWIKDRRGNLPLHVAIENCFFERYTHLCGAGLSTERVLGIKHDMIYADEDCAGGLLVANNRGDTPIDLVCYEFRLRTKYILNPEEYFTAEQIQQPGFEEALRQRRMQCLDILLFSLKVAGASLVGVQNYHIYPPLHGALELVSHDMVKLVIASAEGEDPRFRTARDVLGRTALEIAISVASSGKNTRICYNYWELVFERLLEGDGTITLHQRDSRGRVPLHAAAKKGLRSSVGLALILEACPKAATCRDIQSGMHPFMLAACAPTPDVGSVYMLLREDPFAVSTGDH